MDYLAKCCQNIEIIGNNSRIKVEQRFGSIWSLFDWKCFDLTENNVWDRDISSSILHQISFTSELRTTLIGFFQSFFEIFRQNLLCRSQKYHKMRCLPKRQQQISYKSTNETRAKLSDKFHWWNETFLKISLERGSGEEEGACSHTTHHFKDSITNTGQAVFFLPPQTDSNKAKWIEMITSSLNVLAIIQFALNNGEIKDIIKSVIKANVYNSI